MRDTILIVDDESVIVLGLMAQIEDLGVDVCGWAAQGEEAVRMAEAHQPGIVLVDVRLKGSMDGVEAARAIQQKVGSRIIFLTGSRDAATLARIAGAGASSVLFKPVSDIQLRDAIGLARESAAPLRP